MKTLEQIRKDLKQIQDAFRYGLKREQFGCVSYPKNFQTMAESYLTVSEQAPKRLKTVFDELYVKAKTQKVYAAERGVTEKYIQILNKRLLLFLQAAMADEQIKARRTLLRHTTVTIKPNERKLCAAGKAAADPERFSGTAPRPPRFRSVLFCLFVCACAWLRRPSAKREGDGAALAAPSALPPTCI